jgi:hypothetical protein
VDLVFDVGPKKLDSARFVRVRLVKQELAAIEPLFAGYNRTRETLLHSSFGKHVLTPSLALTGFAATTPASWRVEYFDENL